MRVKGYGFPTVYKPLLSLLLFIWFGLFQEIAGGQNHSSQMHSRGHNNNIAFLFLCTTRCMYSKG